MVPVIEALETHDGIATTAWAPSTRRPAGYPADLPFVAERAATLLAVRGSTTIEWDSLPPRAVETLARELVDAGWVETTLPDSSMPGMTIRPFRRDVRQRVLTHDGRLLSLLETRAE
ncbi:MAG: hypothetical protein ABIQ41_09080 [Gemmatimonadales bacterium]